MPILGLNRVTHLCALLTGISLFGGTVSLTATELTGRDYAVELTANIASDPPEISLNWPGDQYARGYTIRRKLREEDHWKDIGTADGPATGYLDRDLQTALGYEYQVVKDSSLGIEAYGYIYAGINLPLVEDRGVVIIVAEDSVANALAPELLRLEYDLIGEGWSVERTTVSATNTPPEVKGKIQSIYAKDPVRTHALFLFGHVPVPYSGNIMPDGHDNHLGAWPADVYYADLDGAWTDETVNSTTSAEHRNWNIPGDGKFDQDEPPSPIELETGRVDLSRMTCFLNKTPSRSEIDLARQYLDKNHRFRVGGLPIARRAIIFDRIESKTAEPVAAMAWRNFPPLVGADVKPVPDLQYFPMASSGTYLWSSVTSGGSATGSDRVGTSDAFALSDVNVVFTTFLGSYFGDWDVESCFLRAPLGAHGTVLTSVYSGQPQWLFHPMGLGEPIGYSAKITQQNNKTGIYPPHNNGAGEVHVALMGDPTLRAYPVPSVLNLKGEPTEDGIVVGWQVPVIEGYQGCLVYTSSNPKGPYRRMTDQPISGFSFRLHNIQPTDFVMVKALALTRTPSGSFFNSSVGAFYPDPVAQIKATPPDRPSNVTIGKVTAGSITITWVGSTLGTSGFRIERKDPGGTLFHEIASTSGETFSFQDSNLVGSGNYAYRLRAFNQSGSSAYSQEAFATTLSGTAEFVQLDSVTQGNWIGAYGGDGFIIPGWAESTPASCTLSTSNALVFQTGLTDDVRGPQRTNSTSRSANCWVNGSPLAFNFNFSDEQVHQVSFYMMAWGRKHPELIVEVLDSVSGASLDRRTLSSVDEGIYAIYNVRRQVTFRITPPNVYMNAEIYGLFFDRARVAPLQVQPGPGAFAGHTEVTMSTATANAGIFYTTDGAEPTQSATRYNGSFSLRSSAHIKAQAFRDGFEPSPVFEAQYDNSLPTLVGVISWDSDTSGNWPGKYGSEGFWLPMSNPIFPAIVTSSLDGGTDWSWSDDSEDPRATFVGPNSDLRQARAWYAADSMTLHVNVYDTRMHAVTLYFVDFDGGSRLQQIELLDEEGTLRDKFNMDTFGNGRYLTLGVQGQIQVRISHVHGPNALLSGVFFDPAPVPSFKPEPLEGLSVIDGLFRFNMPAFPGLRVCTDRSTNLVDWECFTTNLVSGTTAQIGVSIDSFAAKQFFRTHFVP